MMRPALTSAVCSSLLAACLIAAPAAAQSAVAPVLYRACVTCHRSGGIAPMPLVTYQDARPWAKAIKQQVGTRQMPPWGADPHFGKFKNDRSLSDAEIRIIAAWADQGAPKGNDADLPALPRFADNWTNG